MALVDRVEWKLEERGVENASVIFGFIELLGVSVAFDMKLDKFKINCFSRT